MTLALRFSALVGVLLWGCAGSDDTGNNTEPVSSGLPTASAGQSTSPGTTGTPMAPTGQVPSATMPTGAETAPPSAGPSLPAEPTPSATLSAPTSNPPLEPSSPPAPNEPPAGDPPQPPADDTGAGGAGAVDNPGGTPAGEDDTGSGGSGEPVGQGTPRTECPAAPPAEEKAPAQDRALAVSKDEYAQLIAAQEPFQGTRGTLPWHMYTPQQAEADPAARFPLLVVLHGGYGREVEDGNIMVDVAQYLLGSANGLLTDANRDAYPAFILLPHCRVADGCDFGSNEWASSGGANFQVLPEPSVSGGTALELIEYVLDTYAVDASRVYLTGNSMGGGGTWEFAQRRPELFAAVLPVSGHTPNQQQLSTIAEAKLPVWAFGAQNDYTNPYTDTVSAINALQEAGGCAWLTTYQNAGHDDALWSSPYLEPQLWPWLFTQSNPSGN